MIVSPFRTKLTAMIQNGEKNPERDMTNKKALQKPFRTACWQAKQKVKAVA